MYIEIKCPNCGVEYAIEYDEDQSALDDESPMIPEFCPFCGESVRDELDL